MNETLFVKGYEYAKEQYGAFGVDVEAAMAKADAIPVSMHCWQGDDVIGFDGAGELTGGIATTGNYAGRARTAQELRSDIDFARTMIPGATKLNLHASYAEKNGRKIDRDAYTIDEFRSWLDWAKDRKIGLDFNPTFFSHPKMDGDFTLSSFDKGTRDFWIEHGKRCRNVMNLLPRRDGILSRSFPKRACSASKSPQKIGMLYKRFSGMRLWENLILYWSLCLIVSAVGRTKHRLSWNGLPGKVSRSGVRKEVSSALTIMLISS